MSKLASALRPLLLGIALAMVCLMIRSYAIDSAVVYMELSESAPGKYIAKARVNVPDFSERARESALAMREGRPPVNILPHFECDKRMDLRLVRARSRVLGFVPLTESFEIEVQISIDRGTGNRTVREHDADSMIELTQDEARMQAAAIEELERLGYQRAVDLLTSGAYQEPTRLKLPGALVLAGSVLLPMVATIMTRRTHMERDAPNGSRDTTPLPSPTTPEDPQT